jgi:hypothetical protein
MQTPEKLLRQASIGNQLFHSRRYGALFGHEWAADETNSSAGAPTFRPILRAFVDAPDFEI